MSLINEALKKARLEAARQDAARRGLPMPGSQLAGGRRFDSPLLLRAGAIAALALAVALVVALVFWAGRRSGAPESTAVAARAAGGSTVSTPGNPATHPEGGVAATGERPGAAAAGVEGSEPRPGEAAGEARPAAADARTDTQPAAAPAAAAPTTAPMTTLTPAPEPAPVARSRAPEPAAAAAAESGVATEPESSDRAAAAAAADGAGGRRSAGGESRQVRIVTPGAAPDEGPAAAPPRTAVRQLDLPDGTRIELGGIAWSEERPFALINGRVVGAGDPVAGLTVVAIAQRHVELEGEPGRFLLRLK